MFKKKGMRTYKLLCSETNVKFPMDIQGKNYNCGALIGRGTYGKKLLERLFLLMKNLKKSGTKIP
jgi:hypothetical protein